MKPAPSHQRDKLASCSPSPPSLLQSSVAGVRERVRRLLEPALEGISSEGLKGLEALHRELQKT